MLTGTAQIANALYTAPGVYAVLLGSGVSRAAGVPTGWEITLDLVRRIAALRDADCGDDPAAWFRGTFKNEPNYSDIIAELAKTRDERRSLLNSYFEPTTNEMDEQAKQPTAAHRAIARLAGSGHVRLIITTNFDRLMERALADVGIDPIVIASPDAILGSPPLVHSTVTLVKLHGDYRDVRTLNTADELSKYPRSMQRYLLRVLDEFGLLISGWSGEWDTALCRTMLAAPGRRYQTFWTCITDPTETASRLISARSAAVVKVSSADALFDEVADRVHALAQMKAPTALESRQVSALARSYVNDPKHATRLRDLIDALSRDLSQEINGPNIPDTPRDDESIRNAVSQIDGSTLRLRTALASALSADKSGEISAWLRPFTIVYDGSLSENGHQELSGLKWLALSEIFYVIGSVAFGYERFDVIRALFDVEFDRPFRDEGTSLDVLPAVKVGGFDKSYWQKIEGYERRHLPLNDYLHELVIGHAEDAALTKRELSMAFERFEMLIAIVYGSRSPSMTGSFWGPPGRYSYKAANSRIDKIERWFLNPSNIGKDSNLSKSGLVGGDDDEFAQWYSKFKDFIGRLSQYYW